MSLGSDEIEHRFGNHAATVEGPNATLPKHQTMRAQYKAFAEYLDSELPDGREKSLVFTKLEEASMFSHKSIASQAPLAEDGEPRG